MRCAEAIRAEEHPRWMILTGLIPDPCEILCLVGEFRRAVLDDTFPAGCRDSDKIVLPAILSR